MPLATIASVDDAVPLAEALLRGGITIIEIGLRTACAADAISEIRRSCPDIVVGAGSVRSTADWQTIAAAGAQFAVSPGTTPDLLACAQTWDLPFLPGASTVSEMMILADAGYSIQKFFPAAAMGGIETINAIGGPLAELNFCPSGGINQDNLKAWLALDNVIAVSGSWLFPEHAVASRNWEQITSLTRHALELLNG